MSAWARLVARFRDRYLVLDRRVLGLFRIAFGTVLLIDVLRRIPDAAFFYSDLGILPGQAMFAPPPRSHFSLFAALSTPAQVELALWLMAGICGLYIAGYRTRLLQVILFVLYTSLNARNRLVENGGTILVGIVAAWSLFLPLGDRFSLDALRCSLRAREERTPAELNERSALAPDSSPYVSLVALGIALQIAVIYLFNALHKTGPTWTNGEAVHWVLWQNRIATIWAAGLREHEPGWLSPLLTRMTLLMEGAAPVLVLSPFLQHLARPLQFLNACALHFGIALLMSLGPFSYAMIALNALLLPGSTADLAGRWLRRGKAARTVAYDPAHGRLHAMARVLARLDTFALLAFADARDAARRPGGPPTGPLAAGDAAGRWTVGGAAVVSVLRSLPLGGVAALLLDHRLGHRLIEATVLRGRPAREPGERPAGARSPSAPGALPPGREGWPWRGVATAVREALLVVLIAALVAQVLHQNPAVPWRLRITPPSVLRELVAYPRLRQGWGMFSPDAPNQDGTIVVDAVTADGRHLDIFTGEPPDFGAPLHGPWFPGSLRCDYFLSIASPRNAAFRVHLKRYIASWQQIEGRPPRDRVLSFAVYWVSNDAPPRGQTRVDPQTIRSTLLFTSEE